MALFVYLILSRFGKILACDGRTDRHTTTAYNAIAYRHALIKLKQQFYTQIFTAVMGVSTDNRSDWVCNDSQSNMLHYDGG